MNRHYPGFFRSSAEQVESRKTEKFKKGTATSISIITSRKPHTISKNNKRMGQVVSCLQVAGFSYLN